MKYIKTALSVIIILVFAYIVIGEFAFTANVPKDGFICEMLPGDNWEIVMEDGSRKPFILPGRAQEDVVRHRGDRRKGQMRRGFPPARQGQFQGYGC